MIFELSHYPFRPFSGYFVFMLFYFCCQPKRKERKGGRKKGSRGGVGGERDGEGGGKEKGIACLRAGKKYIFFRYFNMNFAYC